MKMNSILAGALALGGLVGTFQTKGDEATPGPYIGADLGVALTSDARLRQFPGTVGGSKVEFDPGLRLSLNGGWRFADWVRAGGEFGVISQTIKGADASFAHFPLMANVELQMPNKTRLVPFIGGGPGVSISTIAIDDDSLNGGDLVDGSAADAVFAWQAYAGLRYNFNDWMSLGAVYKYFAADATSWDVHRTATDIRFGRTHTHSVGVSFSMDF